VNFLPIIQNNSKGSPTGSMLEHSLAAFSAIGLGMFFFPESPLYYKRPTGRGRWFYSYFLLLTVISVVGDMAAWLGPPQGTVTLVAAIVPQLLAYVGLFLLIGLRLAAGRETMSRVWLSWGNWHLWLLFAPVIVSFYVLQVVLNAFYGLGPIHPRPCRVLCREKASHRDGGKTIIQA
jgi:hypothetical protein